MFDYTCRLYDALEEQAKSGIFEGKVVETFSKLGISMTHYTPLFNYLRELGCIEMLERGARARPTRYRLYGRPSREAFDGMYLTKTPRPATIPLQGLEKRVLDLERRLDGLELKEMFLNLEKRVKNLEGGSK
jgi:hypothetical protein